MSNTMNGYDANKPAVWLLGDFEHRDFAESRSLLMETANDGPGLPEVIIVAQSRPGTIRERELNRLRRSAPLAGIVSLLGSWCEGETRTGRPLTGTTRLFWYEFSNWWCRQLQLRNAGRCPNWTVNHAPQQLSSRRQLHGANVSIAASTFDTVAAIGDAVRTGTGQFAWWRDDRRPQANHSVDAGVWVGGQLSDSEANHLAKFCSAMAQQGAPVLALLDFPRRDRCDDARRAGAAAVLGVPWQNDDLIGELVLAIVDAKSPGSILLDRAA